MQTAGLKGFSATSWRRPGQEEEDQEKRVEESKSGGWSSGGGRAAGCGPRSPDTSEMRDLDQRTDCRK